jgi:hypothetical protein
VITKIDRKVAVELEEEIKVVLQAIAAKNGPELKTNGGSYDDGTWKPRIEFFIPSIKRARVDNIDSRRRFPIRCFVVGDSSRYVDVSIELCKKLLSQTPVEV